MINVWQPEFVEKEFRHPELVNQVAYDMLVAIRRQYNDPLVITDDARLPLDAPPGSAGADSLHQQGQAFDLRIRDMTKEQLWSLVKACINVGEWVARGQKGGMELEMVWSKTDKHCHVGFFLDGRPNRFELSLE